MKCAACGFTEQERVDDKEHPCLDCWNFKHGKTADDPDYCNYHHQRFCYSYPRKCDHFHEKDFRKFGCIRSVMEADIYACPQCGTLKLKWEEKNGQ
ncbi:MAG: hypothetical protein LBQ88_07255 [Treponema sp.]|nr:hypothetical protein [Treponema sp.]